VYTQVLKSARQPEPSPPSPLSRRRWGTESGHRLALTPLLPLWEKGLGDEGDLCVHGRTIGRELAEESWQRRAGRGELAEGDR